MSPELIEGEATPDRVFSGDGAVRGYIYDPATDTHGLRGDFFGASSWWSQDGRYIAANYADPEHPEQSLQVWDSQTGGTRTYCLPETWPSASGGGVGLVYWSPDSRYLAFLTTLPGEEADIGVHVLILDLTSGTLTDAGIGFPNPLLWIPDAEVQP
jgi:hypothetical protein